MAQRTATGTRASMGATLDELCGALRDMVGGFEPERITATDAARLVGQFAQLERLAAAGRLLAAGRMAATSVWAGDGDTDVAGWMARTTGQSTADAKRDLAAARALGGLDDTRNALRQGRLTKEQVREIAPAAAVAPGQEADLLTEATHGSVERLAGKARAAKAAARRDGPEALARWRRRRAVTHGRSDDGSAWLRASGPPDDIARALAGLAPWTDTVRRATEERLTDEQARFDALVAAATQPVPVDDPTEASGDDATGHGSPGTDAAHPHQPDRCEPGLHEPDLDRPGLHEPDLDRPGLHEPDLDGPGLHEPGLDGVGVDAASSTGVPRGGDGSGVPTGHPDRLEATAGADGSPGPRRDADRPPPPRTPAGDGDRGPREPAAGSGAPTAPSAPIRSSRSRHRWATKVIVNIDLAALRRGFTIPGERCEITGIGEVPVAVVDDLLTREDTFLAAVVRDGIDIQTVTHLGRGPTAAQRTALEADHPTCCIDGCPNPPTVIDHHHRYADDGPHTLANLGPLCATHDRRKTHHGWILVRHGRSRRLYPPDHPLTTGATRGGCVDLDHPDPDHIHPADAAAESGSAGEATFTEHHPPGGPPPQVHQLDLLAG